MKVVLISTYELGRQPFGLASPAVWLRVRRQDVACLDLSREALDDAAVRAADLVAFYVPMHTATRLAADLVAPVRGLNPRAYPKLKPRTRLVPPAREDVLAMR
jgi:hypothetical protein